MASESLGPCCSCGKIGKSVRTIVMLARKGPTPGRGWGCIRCGLPKDGALAVLCDECFEKGADIRFAVDGYPKQGKRVPIESLTERHEHRVQFHPELLAASRN